MAGIVKDEIASIQKDSLSNESEKSRFLRQGNISIILDSYDDLFSDFDPRDVSIRALSDDFLAECKKAVIDKTECDDIELRLLMPKEKRKLSDELKIRKRIKKHFHSHFLEKGRELRDMKKEGYAWFMLGSALTLIDAGIASQEGYFYKLIFVIIEPAGWFTVWTGLQKMFLDSREKKSILEFYKKMANAKIYFTSY